MLAGISHDLRTPLTTINGYLEGLDSGVASTPEMRQKYFTTIKNNAVGMNHIIEQLFLFSKLDMDEFSLSPRRFDIMRAVSDMVEELAEEYAMKGLVITMCGSPENVFVTQTQRSLEGCLSTFWKTAQGTEKKKQGTLKLTLPVAII